MKQIQVLSVFGTRPEAIKMCPLVKELAQRPEFNSMVCVTGQHRQMLDQVLDIFSVRPDYDLNIMKERQTLASITTGVVEGVAQVVEQCRPDIVLVHGDTTTSFAAALGAFYQKTPVGHVEAGLRTYNRYSPFPEEMNRTLTICSGTLPWAGLWSRAGGWCCSLPTGGKIWAGPWSRSATPCLPSAKNTRTCILSIRCI